MFPKRSSREGPENNALIDKAMDLNELKKIIDGENSKVIIMENGEPVLVVMNFDEYRKIKGQNENSANCQKVLQTPAKELIEEPLKIEDLPF